MDLTTAFIGAIVIIFLFYCYSPSAKPKAGPQKAPPQARGARPFTGHLHLMSSGLAHKNLGSATDKSGPIFTIKIGSQRVVVVSSCELAKELFTTCDTAVSSRPRMRAGQHLTYDFAMFGFSPYGPYWREIRKLVTIEMLSNRRIEMQRNVRVSETEQFIKEVYELWGKKKDASGRALVDLKKCFGNLSLNVFLRLVVGKRFESGDNTEETRRLQKVMGDFFHMVGVFVPADTFPFLGWFDLGGLEKKMKDTAKEMDRVFRGWLKEHREKESSGDGKPRDFMDVLLSVVHGANFQSQHDVDTIIKATCGVLISGGSDTTTVVSVWVISILLNNPKVLKKAQEELDKHVGRERRVEESDITNLVYLQAIVKETLRLYPPLPLGPIREFTEDCTVGGYHVSKGTWLIVNLWKLHRDPQVWSEDPLEFRPERFMNSNQYVDFRVQDFELIPFGGGRRSCPGTNFGLLVLYLVLANFLQAFELSNVSDEKVDMSESGGLSNSKITPLDVFISPRLSPSLY